MLPPLLRVVSWDPGMSYHPQSVTWAKRLTPQRLQRQTRAGEIAGMSGGNWKT